MSASIPGKDRFHALNSTIFPVLIVSLLASSLLIEKT